MKTSCFSVVFLVTLLAACDDAPAACVTRSDCEALEACVNGSCVLASEDSSVPDGGDDSSATDGGLADAPAADGGALDAPTPDSGSADVDAPVEDVGDDAPDAGSDAGPDSGPIDDVRVAACEPHQQALYFEGAGFIFTGTQLITQAEANFTLGGTTGVYEQVRPTVPALGSRWAAEFRAPGSFSLEVQNYPNATRAPFHSGDEAGMSVTGDGRGCNAIDGNFEVHRIERDSDGAITSVLISFEQFCLDTPGDVLRGCLKHSP